jgi:hypothetical protein
VSSMVTPEAAQKSVDDKAATTKTTTNTTACVFEADFRVGPVREDKC